MKRITLYKGRPNESGITVINPQLEEKDDCAYSYSRCRVLELHANCQIPTDVCVIAFSMPPNTDFSSWKYLLFCQLQEAFNWRRFTDDNEVQVAFENWFHKQHRNFFTLGIQQIVDRWDTCFNLQGRNSPCDFDLIPKIKELIHGRRFATRKDISNAARQHVTRWCANADADGIQQLPHHCQRVETVAGDYIEGL
ncbi:uncharacterized protein TNCV_4603021 [Trichonephila clavipes]|nr:uncharacterized protein TNCV_4603021 [Trichonephila clavipes]